MDAKKFDRELMADFSASEGGVMAHRWGPPQHRRNRFTGFRPITAWECLDCGTAVLVDGWRATMPTHWQQRKSPCPPKPRCPHWNSIDIGTHDDDISTITVRECLDCGCIYNAIRRKDPEWQQLPNPGDVDYRGSIWVNSPAPPSTTQQTPPME